MKLTHRALLFSFLGDCDLTKAQRAVGVVLIMRCGAKHKFWSGWRDQINWLAISGLSGYSVATAQKSYKELMERGWIDERRRGEQVGYLVNKSRLDDARERQKVHFVTVAKKRDERQATTAKPHC